MSDTPYYSDDQVTLHLGKMLDVLPSIPDASIDAVVCDPPYGLADHHPTVIAKALAAWLAGDRAHVPDGRGFMGKDWDRFVPPPAAWEECWRVLKPGGHLVAFAGARTADLMGLSIRLAGFDIRDSLHWFYGSGFPKGQDIAKSIDKRRDDRDQILQVTAWLAAVVAEAGWDSRQMDALFGFSGNMSHHWTTQGKTAAVPRPEQWDRLRQEIGFDDTDIRPLVAELNARKGTLGEDWARREVIGERTTGIGTGRGAVAFIGDSDDRTITAPASDATQRWQGWNTQLKPAHEPIILARKTTGFNTTVANVLEHGTGALNVDGCRVGMRESRPLNRQASIGFGGSEAQGLVVDGRVGRWPTNVLLAHPPILAPDGEPAGDACADGCVAGCPVADLDRQSGILKSGVLAPHHNAKESSNASMSGGNYEGRIKGTFGGDCGGASRFFPVFRYEAKAPASERPRLADGTAHPTVKPQALMAWLVRLVTPPDGVVLDPFTGSGTTLAAAVAEGMRAVGIEQHQPYADLTVQRLSKPIALGLFGEIA